MKILNMAITFQVQAMTIACSSLIKTKFCLGAKSKLLTRKIAHGFNPALPFLFQPTLKLKMQKTFHLLTLAAY